MNIKIINFGLLKEADTPSRLIDLKHGAFQSVSYVTLRKDLANFFVSYDSTRTHKSVLCALYSRNCMEIPYDVGVYPQLKNFLCAKSRDSTRVEGEQFAMK